MSNYFIPTNNKLDASASSQTIQITRRVEFDAGHRLPAHYGQCRNMHGHRYVLEVSLTGKVTDHSGESKAGMLMDFSSIKTIINEVVVSKWDHAFIVYEKDTQVLNFLQSLPDHKTVVLNKVPTVENLALEAFDLLSKYIKNKPELGLSLNHLRLYETPNCWADVNGTHSQE